MIAHVKKQDWINITGALIASGLICVLAYCTHALITTEVPTANRDALMVVIGILSANVATIINWFFGSGADSKRSTDAVSDMAATARAIQAAASPHPDVALSPGETATVTAEEAK